MALQNTIRNYPWGSTTALAKLQGRIEATEPEAELWIGAHPDSPSEVIIEGRSVPLNQLINERPREMLGPIIQRYGVNLPFLLKILAVQEPLSIQVHPNLEQAQAGYYREDSTGIGLQSFNRCYHDRNHKREVIVAIDSFSLLSGFLPFDVIKKRLDRINMPVLAAKIDLLNSKPEPTVLRSVLAAILRLSRSEIDDLIKCVDTHFNSTSSFDYWTRKLANYYPYDAGVISPQIMNLVTLAPEEGVYTEAGTPHSALYGTAVELQSASDNVVRGGLTDKHIDTQEFLRISNFNPLKVSVLKPRLSSNGERHYKTAANEFSLSSIALNILEQGQKFKIITSGPEILLPLRGHAVLIDAAGRSSRYYSGQPVFVPATVSSYRVYGTALMFRARVKDPKTLIIGRDLVSK